MAGVSMVAAGYAMRFTPLLLLALPLLGAGWLSPKAAPVASMEALRHVTATPSHEEPLEVDEAPTSARSAAVDPAIRAEAVATSPVPGILTAATAALPPLPIKALFEEGATPERYAEWYEGTPTELLYQSLVRLQSLRSWDPRTCACADPDLLIQHAETHDRIHTLNERGELLLHEETWLRSEVRRQVRADLESGGSLQAFRLPQTEAQLRGALEDRSREELKILDQLLRDARSATRHAAIEAEFAAGNFKVGAHKVWG